jgi:uncharacterized membrane protein YhaH (DUF805 family)
VNWYFEALKKYAVFTGRARRREYWMFELWNPLIMLALFFISFRTVRSGGMGLQLLPLLYVLGVALPAFSSTIRRLHDTNRSGWWLLINLVPILGPISLFIFLVENSTPGDNRFGPNPKLEVDRPEGEIGTLAPPL